MALIDCPECGHRVSDRAVSCPECGVRIAGPQPVEVKASKQNLQKLFAVIMTLAGLIGLIATQGTTYWALIFIVGLIWFIIIRIIKD